MEKYAGDALLALFGAPVAHGDDAARALHAALEMHAELERIRPTLPPEARGLTLHVGVNSGHGIARLLGGEGRMDYAVLGDAVILAQRLEASAPAGVTYVGEATRALVPNGFGFEPVGELSVKGISGPVVAWRLVAASPDTRPSHGQPLRGRHRELERLVRALPAQAAGDGGAGWGGVATLVGEPGIGKSTLVRALRAYGDALAYRPMAELLRRWVGLGLEPPPEQVAEALERETGVLGVPGILPYLRRLVGAPDAGLPPLEPEALQRAIHDAVARWLAAVAASTPLVLHVEDLHWADESTVSLLADLAPELAGWGVLLVVTSRRDEGGDALDRLIAGVPGDRRIALALGPFDRPALEAVVTDLLGGEPPARIVDGLLERTGGNPFFVEATVRELLDEGVLQRRDAVWVLDPAWAATSVPPTVEGVLAARLDRLPAPEARILGLAAVIGRRVRRRLLAAVAEEPDLEVQVDRLIAAGLLDRSNDPVDDLVAFHHALVQDVAYNRLLRRRRRELHARVAAAAEALYGTGDDIIDLLARHLYLAEAGAPAVAALVRAGERARRLFANQEAIVAFGRAVEVAERLAVDDPAWRDRLPALRLELADLEELSGRYADARTRFLQVAESSGGPRAWAGAASPPASSATTR